LEERESEPEEESAVVMVKAKEWAL